MKDQNRIKMAMIVGAVKAIEFKDQKRMVTKEEIIRYISDNSDEFLSEMDNPL